MARIEIADLHEKLGPEKIKNILYGDAEKDVDKDLLIDSCNPEDVAVARELLVYIAEFDQIVFGKTDANYYLVVKREGMEGLATYRRSYKENGQLVPRAFFVGVEGLDKLFSDEVKITKALLFFAFGSNRFTDSVLRSICAMAMAAHEIRHVWQDEVRGSVFPCMHGMASFKKIRRISNFLEVRGYAMSFWKLCLISVLLSLFSKEKPPEYDAQFIRYLMEVTLRGGMSIDQIRSLIMLDSKNFSSK